MKKILTISVMIITGLVIFTQSVFAWTPPNSSHNVLSKPGATDYLYKNTELINIGCIDWLNIRGVDVCPNVQSKKGGFITESFLKSGNEFGWSDPGYIIAESAIFSVSSKTTSGFFKLFAPSTQSQLSFGFVNNNDSLSQMDAATTPLFGGYFSDALKLNSDPQFCNSKTMITTDTPAFQIWDKAANKNAVINARGIQLSGGNPQPGMILVSTDDQGNAVWAMPKLSPDGTVVEFDYATPTSPVVNGQAICN